MSVLLRQAGIVFLHDTWPRDESESWPLENELALGGTLRGGRFQPKYCLKGRCFPLSERKRAVRRRFDYDRKLLPNTYLAQVDEGVTKYTEVWDDMTPGYPAWNLLYYVATCSLMRNEPAVVVETGTNRGLSTIVLAQAVKDARAHAVVDTVDVAADSIAVARENVVKAGLSEFVRFHHEDALDFLSKREHIDFLFLDDDHSYEHVASELEVVAPKSARIYFDNTAWGGVAQALEELKDRHGGNLVHFPNCSAYPPGNALWEA